MKKLSRKLLCIVLALTLAFTGPMLGAQAADAKQTATNVGVKALEVLITGLIGGINLAVPDNKNFTKVSEHTTENFYEGTTEFLSAPAEHAAWQLGYDKETLIPDDVLNGEYYLGGFMTLDNGMVNRVEEIVGGMDVRTVALSDGSGRGITVFANLDCIGFSNGDIKAIRARVAEELPDVDFNSINISSTHCHSCIDTQGLWTNLLPKLLRNLFKSYLRLDMERGVKEDYVEGFLYDQVVASIKKAVADMTEGTMTLAVKTLNPDYFNNRNRKSATALISDLTRLTFTPADASRRPTMLVNLAGHPDVTGLATSDPQDNGRQLSGDFVTYMQDTIEAAGYNFMFLQGPIAGIYIGRGLTNDDITEDPDRRYMQSVRYGREMGKIALYLTNTMEEIEADYQENFPDDWAKLQADLAQHNAKVAAGESKEENYTLWYEGWTPVQARTLDPLLNIRLAEIKLKVTNPLIKLVGKLNLANYSVCKEGLGYYIFTEIGYMELGDQHFVMTPGEVVQDLVAGGASLTAAGSFSGKDFGKPTVYELFGEGTVCIGLCNDAIGYIVPDNDFSMGIADDHYQELLSVSKTGASTMMQGFADLAEEIAE
ncbi:MAG: hypothetical protein IJK64_10285 [Clostridia bacterium]|nr:hypothetical protein [Clostridia bacterium]